MLGSTGLQRLSPHVGETTRAHRHSELSRARLLRRKIYSMGSTGLQRHLSLHDNQLCTLPQVLERQAVAHLAGGGAVGGGVAGGSGVDGEGTVGAAAGGGSVGGVARASPAQQPVHVHPSWRVSEQVRPSSEKSPQVCLRQGASHAISPPTEGTAATIKAIAMHMRCILHAVPRRVTVFSKTIS